MSTTIWDDSGLVITIYAGPLRPDAQPRRRVQVAGWDDHTQTRTWATLSMAQWASLCRAVEALGVNCEGPEL